MIQSLQSDPPVYRGLLNYFQKQKANWLLEAIQKHFDSRRVYCIDGVQIKETTTGYEALDPGQDTPIQLSASYA